MDDYYFQRETERALLLLQRLEGILPNDWEWMDTFDDISYYSYRGSHHSLSLEVFYDHMNPISYRWKVLDDYYDTIDEAFSRYNELRR